TQVLAAAAGGAHAVAPQAVREVVGSGEVAAHRTRVQHLGVGDGPVGDPPEQSAPDDLDLGQLGHGVSPRALFSRTGRRAPCSVPVLSGERPPRAGAGARVASVVLLTAG